MDTCFVTDGPRDYYFTKQWWTARELRYCYRLGCPYLNANRLTSVHWWKPHFYFWSPYRQSICWPPYLTIHRFSRRMRTRRTNWPHRYSWIVHRYGIQTNRIIGSSSRIIYEFVKVTFSTYANIFTRCYVLRAPIFSELLSLKNIIAIHC